MKLPILSFSISFILAGALSAGVQNLTVTPATLAGWQLTGADPDNIAAQETIQLPPGAELARTFSGGAVVLYTVSSAHFAANMADWPVLQVGPAALALIRNGTHGELVLLIGETVSTIPGEVTLGVDGDTVHPLEVALGYDPAGQVGVAAFAGQVRSFKVKSPTNGTAVEVAISAGQAHSWTQDSIEVLVIGPDGPTDAEKAVREAEAAKRASLLRSATEKLLQAGQVIGGTGGIGTATGNPASTSTGSTLEIYTPAAVRHTAATVRAVITRAKAK